MITYKIVITAKADDDENIIYTYILEAFGEIYADKFRQNLISFFQLLSKHPFIGRPAKNSIALRVYLFGKRNKIVYQVTEDSIVIIRILPTKTNLASGF